ncbi:MAG: ATP-binding cassette domain-containing protein [Acidobacteria bacterium]|nr:ATP-binding cassette domain-containing protein [Acidobacteriota bacterium]
MASEIIFDEVGYEAGETTILSGISIAIHPGETVSFIGRSGAGKTSALRMINGLLFPTEGAVTIDGETTKEVDLIELRRRTGYVIQGTGLFPHRTVFDNVATVPRLLGWEEGRVALEVDSMLEAVRLSAPKYRSRFPRSLSGGERQRVGIARALVGKPDILLCDEPFGALDPIVRLELQELIRDLKSRLGATVVFVTHDLTEALRVSDRVLLFEAGSVVVEATTAQFLQSRVPLARTFIDAAGVRAS